MMHALEPRVHDPIFQLIEHLIPPPPPHPLGCHRPRTPNRVIFRGLLLRLVTGSSWDTIEFMMGGAVSDTTLRARRDEWEQSGLFQKLLVHALGAYHRVIGIDLTRLFIDGCNNRALQGGEGTGFDPKHPGKRGWKFVIATDAVGIPIAFTTDAANRNDYPLMFDVLDDLQARNLLRLVGSFHADRGFNYNETPTRLADAYALTDFRAPPRNDPYKGRRKRSPSGPRWIVEAANSWLRNNGQIANNTDRKPEHREAALCFAITILLVHRISHPKHTTWRPIR
jgi:transposase